MDIKEFSYIEYEGTSEFSVRNLSDIIYNFQRMTTFDVTPEELHDVEKKRLENIKKKESIVDIT